MDDRAVWWQTPFPEAPHGYVVVGVDGSDVSLRALDRAVEEAQRRGAALEIVHGWPWGHGGEPTIDVPQSVLEFAADRARQRAPELNIATTVTGVDAAEALVRRGRDAVLTVVGTRGLGGFAGLLLGSVSLRVAAHSAGPLLVVRGDRDLARTALGYDQVLLGLESDADTAAAAFAFEEAARSKARLRVLHAWTYRQLTPVGLATVPDERMQEHLDRRSRDEAAVPANAVARLREAHPEVAADTDSVRGGPTRTLLEATEAADLVVIAAHRRKGNLGLQLGPVTHALLHHAHCPVVLVPVGPADESDG
ncbi:universal stress protein [Streptomyces sp. NBC_01262]|uniref:universal stress protein n=1 Tax=Streptomyces sp. NBC_01262 TaxID=2903803 RepID=UPI002E2FA0BC|nr:universal stress protein [Streptomyces sp. NBC_01262]